MGLLEKQQIRELVGKHSERLGVDPDVALGNLMNLAETTIAVESEGDPQAANETSSAKGLFQFIDDAVQPAINRAKKYVEGLEWMERLTDIRELDKDQQTLLFLGDILEKTAVVNGKKRPGVGDKIMKEVMTGNPHAPAVAYEYLHHTEPDEATRSRMTKYFGRPERQGVNPEGVPMND